MVRLKTTDAPIKQFFYNNYEIPIYQRGYSWTKSEFEDLWEDIDNQMSEDSFNHFYGQIVIHLSGEKDREVKYIIDGQQRITTLTIIFSVLRTYFNDILLESETKCDESEKEEITEEVKKITSEITNMFIGSLSRRNNLLKLTLGKTGKDFFYKYVQDDKPTKLSKEDITNPSEKNINDAINFFRIQISEKIREMDINEKFDYLEKMVTTLGDKFDVSCIETDEQTHAFTIFETLNARGRSLATSDLLKNHIIRTTSEEYQESVNLKWEKMTDNLEMIDPTRYIRSFWNATEKFSRDKSLYKNLRRKYTSSSDVARLTTNLLKYSSDYQTLVLPDTYPHSNKKINKLISDLKTLSASTFYPLYLSMVIKSYEDSDVEKTLKSIINYYVRNIVVGDKSPNSTELFFSELAKKVYDSEDVIFEQVQKDIENKTDDDIVFKRNFELLNSTSTKQQRYLLIQLEQNLLGPETKVNVDEIHVEHIMPQSNDLWQIDEIIHAENLNKIGNLTLLGKEYNRDASNYEFERKKEYYEKSTINITKYILKTEEWGVESIIERQKFLADIALKVW